MHQEDRPAELFAQAIGGEVGFAARKRAVVHHQAGRLVDHRQRIVAEDYRQWRWRRVRHIDAQSITKRYFTSLRNMRS